MQIIGANIKFEPRDLWVGLYWKRTRKVLGVSHLHLYVCAVPLFPIHITVRFGKWPEPIEDRLK